MLSRRHVVGAAAALPFLSASPLRPAFDEMPSLRAAAASRGLRYGCAAASYQLRDADFRGLLAREAALLVPEYEMKRSTLEPQRGNYDFSGAEVLLAFARMQGMAMRGHTLVWYASNPPWLEDAVRARRDERLFTDHIARVIGHFGKAVPSWDVVNEAIWPEHGRSDGLRRSFWLETFGPSYIDSAFHAARAAAPQAQLVYNDWGCEEGGARHDRFRSATLNFLEGAKARGVPIDALGMQGHLSAFAAGIDAKALGRFLAEVSGLGLAILITELDVDDSGGPAGVAPRDAAAADAAARFLDIVLDCPAVTGVLSWGLSDRYLEPPSWRQRLSGYSPRRLPFDRDLVAKPLNRALIHAFEGKPASAR